jgi:hypothetical protein
MPASTRSSSLRKNSRSPDRVFAQESWRQTERHARWVFLQENPLCMSFWRYSLFPKKKTLARTATLHEYWENALVSCL